MISIIEKEKALPIVSNYFSLLSRTGYVKHDTVRRYLLYLFLIDFTEWVYPFITNEDYFTIDKALIQIFSGGGCLLPYQTIFTNRAKVGKAYVGVAHYTGHTTVIRRTEDGELRSNEEQTTLRAMV